MKQVLVTIVLLMLLAGCATKPLDETIPVGSFEPENPPEDVILTPYLGAYPYYGLMTTKGEIITEAESAEYSLLGYYGKTMEDFTAVPVWEMSKADEKEEDRRWVALYAIDGSWHTDFVYRGCTATPYGLFVGDDDGAYLLAPDNGQILKHWTWDMLHITQPQSFPWFTGDAQETAQWIDGQLFLGSYANDSILFDLETDTAREIPVDEWLDILYTKWMTGRNWDVITRDGIGIVTVWEIEGETEQKTQFEIPFEAYYGYTVKQNGVPRIILHSEDYNICAVYTVEGEAVIPMQKGYANDLGYRGALTQMLCVEDKEAESVAIYDWDGTLQCTLPMRTGDSISLTGALICITDWTHSILYYDPKTGEKVAEFAF